MIQRKKLIKIEYYTLNDSVIHQNNYELKEINFMVTQSKNIKRAVNDHYKKDKNKTIMMIYKIDDYTQRIIEIKHLAKKPLITI